jgi:hypothetical protein
MVLKTSNDIKVIVKCEKTAGVMEAPVKMV